LRVVGLHDSRGNPSCSPGGGGSVLRASPEPPRSTSDRGSEVLRRDYGGARARQGSAERGHGGWHAIRHRVASAQQFPRISLTPRQLRSRRFPGAGRRTIVAGAPNPHPSSKHPGIGAPAPRREVVRSPSFSLPWLGRGLQRHCPSYNLDSQRVSGCRGFALGSALLRGLLVAKMPAAGNSSAAATTRAAITSAPARQPTTLTHS
jgi:hypothetical protein